MSGVPRWLVSVVVVEGDVEERTNAQRCLTEQEIDELIQDRLSGEVEEFCLAHLVGCQACVEKVENERDFAHATREAILQMQKEPAAAVMTAAPGRGFRSWAQAIIAWPSWRGSLVAATLCLVVAVSVVLTPSRMGDSATELALRSERGRPGVMIDAAAASRLRLKLDVTDVDANARYQVSLADASGRTLERSEIRAVAGTATLNVEQRLAPGQYWVRLASPDGVLLREYALRVR